MPDPKQLLWKVYEAFNAREIDEVLAHMCDDVVWPNGMEGGVVHGHGGIREYWTRQWAMINPTVIPLSATEEPDGRLNLEVHQRVLDLQGAVLADKTVHHVYQLRDGYIASMEIRDAVASGSNTA